MVLSVEKFYSPDEEPSCPNKTKPRKTGYCDYASGTGKPVFNYGPATEEGRLNNAGKGKRVGSGPDSEKCKSQN